MMERYRNKRTVFRKGNGRFRKASMQDMGIPESLINHEKRKCSYCEHEWFPLLKTGKCPNCTKEREG